MSRSSILLVFMIALLFSTAVCFGETETLNPQSAATLAIKDKMIPNGQLYYKNKMILENDCGLEIKRQFILQNEIVLIVNTLKAKSSCTPHTMLVSIDKYDDVSILKEFVWYILFDDATHKDDRIVLQFIRDAGCSNFYYTYADGELIESGYEKNHEDQTAGKLLSGNELIDRFKDMSMIDISTDPDFQTTIRSKLSIGWDFINKIMSTPNKPTVHDGSLIIEGHVPYAKQCYATLKISRDGIISYLKHTFSVRSSREFSYEFSTNDPKFSNCADLSLAPQTSLPTVLSVSLEAHPAERLIYFRPLDSCEWLYAALGNFQAQQQNVPLDELRKGLPGRAVIWSLRLSTIQTAKEGFTISTGPSSPKILLDMKDSKPAEFEYMKTKKPGDWIEFWGVAPSTFARDLKIKQVHVIH